MKIHLFIITLFCFLRLNVCYSTAQSDFEVWLKQPVLHNASVSILGIDASTGDTLFEKDAERSLTPASVMKLFSTATALEMLGRDFKFKTEIAYSGSIDSQGNLHGDIYIVGYGDPCLGAERFAELYLKPVHFIDTWAKAIKDAGIKKVNGAIVGDPSAFCFPFQYGSWLYEDVGNYYAAPLSGLSIFENLYKLHFVTGFFDGDSTRLLGSEPEISGMTFTNKVVSATKGGDQSYIFGGAECNHKIIKGSLPVKQSKFTIKGSIPNPPLYAAERLCDALTKANISVGKPPRALDEQEQRPPLKTIYTTWSPPLKRICDATNLWSLNLYADHLAIQCAVNQNKTAIEAGVVLLDFWKTKGMNTRGLKIVDGSGLSVFNTVNAGHLVYLLHYMKKKSALAEVFETTLPVAGKSGTLSRYCVYGSGKERIKAKGGSMTGVRSMAGYANTKSNKQIIFAVIINNYDESNGEIRKTLEDLLNMIAEM